MGNKSQSSPSNVNQQNDQDLNIQQSMNLTSSSKYNDDEPIDITLKKEQKKDQKVLDAKQHIQLEVKGMHNQIQQLFDLNLNINRLKKESQILPTMVSLKTQTIEETEENAFKPGIDIICVIDKSGSMQGQKIKLVQDTLKYIIDLLGDNDRFCLITFESSAQRLSPLLKVNNSNKKKFGKLFSGLSASGGTNIDSGMTLALKTLKERKIVNHVSSIFLLSDGQDGSAQYAVDQSIKQYNIEDPFTIHTFGFGTDHDGQLMKSLSALKDGNFYYIETLEIVNECFVDALGGLISVIAQNVKLTCKLIKQPAFSDMRIIKTYGNWKYNEDNAEYTLTINQLLGGVSKDNILEINIPPIKKQLLDTEKNLEILSFTVQFQQIGEEKGNQKIEQALKIEFFNEDEEFHQSQADKDVSINYLRVKGALGMEEANAKAAQGQYKEAQQILDDALKLISSSEYIEEPCLKVLLNDLKNSKNACESSNYQSFGANLMVQKTNIHMFQRSAPMQTNEQQCCDAQQDLYSNNVQMEMKYKVRSKKS